MAIAYKILGQLISTANTAANLYSVPAATSAVLSTVCVCNQANTAATFKLAVRPVLTALGSQHYLNFDTQIPGNDSITLTLGITMGNTDVMVVNASTSNISFSAFGSEIT